MTISQPFECGSCGDRDIVFIAEKCGTWSDGRHHYHWVARCASLRHEILAYPGLEIVITAPSISSSSSVSELARELHMLIRNGKSIPYADDEEQSFYELIVISWLDKVRLT